MIAIDSIRTRLCQPLPGVRAHASMMPQPQLDKLPVARPPRPASVLLLLYPEATGEWVLVLIRRALHPDRPDTHGGQLALPGGCQKPGETLQATALRETWEEIGVSAEQIILLGPLSSLEVTTSNHRVQPFLGYCPQIDRFRADDQEVAEILKLPLAELLSPTASRSEWVEHPRLGWRQIPYFTVGQYKVWGATAMILAELRVLLAAAERTVVMGAQLAYA